MKVPFNLLIERFEKMLPANQLAVKYAISSLILGKHALIEDSPGMGKTLLVKILAKSFDLEFRRIQFTNDLLPGDILGTHLFHPQKGHFEFYPGPILTDILLADEINRGSPRTQSALLEAMEEKQISLDQKVLKLSDFFCVLATQNPREQVGTEPLPESQLDRFHLKFSMGRMTIDQEQKLIEEGARHQEIETLPPLFSKKDILNWRGEVYKVQLNSQLSRWMVEIIHSSRLDDQVTGLSPRAGVDWGQMVKVWAYLNGRNKVEIDDLYEVFVPVCAHRLFSHKSLPVDEEKNLAWNWLKNLKQI